jgi:hypothetical protein
VFLSARRLLCSVFVTVVGALAFAAAPALAAEGYGLTGSFGSMGSAAGQLEHPEGVAVNDATGDVYVADPGNRRVDQFTSAGVFERAFGAKVEPSGANVCTALTGCQQGAEGSGPGEFKQPTLVAVDNSTGASKEDVYVMDAGNNVVDKFSAAGAYDGQLAGGNCEEPAVVAPACVGSKLVPFEPLHGIAVDPSGDLWVLAGETVYEFSDTGVVLKSFRVEMRGGSFSGLAVDAVGPGHVYANRYGSQVQFEATTGAEVSSQYFGGQLTALAIDPANDDLLVDKSDGTIARYGPITEGEQLPLQVFPGEGETLPESHGIAVNGSAAGGPIYATESAADEVAVLTEGPRPEPPETKGASGETQTTAMLHGELNPGGAEGELKYHFVYSTEGKCTGTAASGVVPQPPGTITKADKALVAVEATDLEPLAKYTVCLIAANKFGETLGNEEPFQTKPAPPTIISESSETGYEEYLNEDEARLFASINPNNEETGWKFEYSLTEAAGDELTGRITTLPGAPPLMAEFNESGVGVDVELERGSIKPDTTYYYRVLAENEQSKIEDKPAEGQVEHFETHPELPETRKPEAVAHTSATLRGVLNPKQAGDGGTYEFRYAPSQGDSNGLPYTCGGEGEETTPATAFAGNEQEAASAVVSGLMVPATKYTFCLVERNRAGRATQGPAETFQTAPLPPTIEGESVSFVETGAATLQARIDPEGAETAYHFEYGPEAGVYDASVPVPAGEIPAGVAGVPVNGYATGLRPGSTYHYRVVASSVVEGKPVTIDGPDQTFTTRVSQGTGSPASCPNERARIEQPYGLGLPDCRAYELVSPPDTEGSEFVGTLNHAAVSGEAVAYGSQGSFSGPVGAQLESAYVSRRGSDGWSTQNITPPTKIGTSGTIRENYLASIFTPELTKGVLFQLGGTLGSEVPAGYDDLYVADFAERTYQTVTNIPPPGIPPYENRELNYIYPFVWGASADLSHVVFNQNAALTPGASAEYLNDLGHVSQIIHAYLWANGSLRQVDIPPTGTTFTGSGSISNAFHPISEDGLKIVFTGPTGQLYVRENPEQQPYYASECAVAVDACTVEVSASERTNAQGQPDPDPHGPRPATDEGSSADGSRVFFSSSAELTDNANTGEEDDAANLYEYNFNAPEGKRLTDLTVDTATDQLDKEKGAQVDGVADIGEDGSYVYFVANGVLASNKREYNNAKGEAVLEEARAGEYNLYVYHEGAVTFIATLSPSDQYGEFSGGGTISSGSAGSRVSADGTHLAFISERSLTGYDNQPVKPGGIDDHCDGPEGGCGEVYLFDAGSDSHPPTLVCASCDPSGARPLGAATGFPSEPELYYATRNLSENGSRLFFDSSDPLVPHDSNGLQNVYEYENGHDYLISDGAGSAGSSFLDASSNGENVFFTTTDGLVGQDRDKRDAVYDARVDGGFPAPAAPAECVNADSCHGPQSPQPGVFGVSGTATFVGIGNFTPPPPNAPKMVTKKTVKCKHGYTKNKHGKCVMSKKKHKAKRASDNRRAGR